MVEPSFRTRVLYEILFFLTGRGLARPLGQNARHGNHLSLFQITWTKCAMSNFHHNCTISASRLNKMYMVVVRNVFTPNDKCECGIDTTSYETSFCMTYRTIMWMRSKFRLKKVRKSLQGCWELFICGKRRRGGENGVKYVYVGGRRERRIEMRE